jgi:hypothetical protein
MAKRSRELIFIKDTGVLIGEVLDPADKEKFDLEKFVLKTVEIDEALDEYWYGDYETGEIRSRAEKAVVTESLIKYITNTEIVKKYPIHKQINILIDMIDRLDVEKTPEFNEFKEFLSAARQKHSDRIEVYASTPEAYVWISEEDEQEIINKKALSE